MQSKRKKLPPVMSTKQAMKEFRVKSYDGFNAICNQHKLKPSWRSGEGNMYRGVDIEKILYPEVDTEEKEAFNVF